MTSALIQQPEKTFDRVFVVNLDRRPDRWRAFADRLPADWPFAPPVRVAGIDAQRVRPPDWARMGNGWGVFRTFYTLLEQALNEQARSILMMEDDALFCPDFTPKVLEWLRHVPAEWKLLYLGGQHCRRRRQINDWLVESENVNRCHAWAVNGPAMQEVYDWLNRREWGRTPKGTAHHIDHHLGVLHEQHFAKADQFTLCPPRWFIGQAGGASNISGKHLPDRFWHRPPPGSKHRKYLFVAMARSGTKYIAKLCQAHGQQVWHEHMGRAGISSWFMAADDPQPPYGQKIARSEFTFDHVVHVVRDPLRHFASILFTDHPSPTALAYRIKHAPRIGEVLDNPYEMTARSILEWERLIGQLNPECVVRVEEAVQVLPARFGWQQKRELPPPTVNTRPHRGLAWDEIAPHLLADTRDAFLDYIARHSYLLPGARTSAV